MSYPKHVLIVDDDEKIGKLFKEILAEEHIKADYVLTGADGVEKVKNGTYDAVFMDVVMPGMNGVKALEKIREFNKEIPVIMITGYSVSELLDKAKKYGASVSLNKPINIAQIVDVLRSVMKDTMYSGHDSKKCLVIDKRGNAETILYSLLEEAGFSTVILDDCGKAEKDGYYKSFDVIVFNVDFNNQECIKKCINITETFPKEKIVVLVDTSEEELLVEKAFALGAGRYVRISSVKEEIAQVLKGM